VTEVLERLREYGLNCKAEKHEFSEKFAYTRIRERHAGAGGLHELLKALHKEACQGNPQSQIR
jgi:hypothetical protein